MNCLGPCVLDDKNGERTLISVVQHSYMLSEVCECRVQQNFKSTDNNTVTDVFEFGINQ